MDEYPLAQSVWGRAWTDITHFIQHSKWYFAFVELFVVAVGSVIGAIIIPENAGATTSAIYPAVGGVIGAIVAFVIMFLLYLVLAPYRQRNEARALLQKQEPVPLSNRDLLIRIIGKVRQKALSLMTAQQQLDTVQQRSPNLADTQTLSNRDNAYHDFKQAMDELEGEKLVAGEAFRNTLGNLTTFVWFHIWGNIHKPVQVGGEKPVILSDLQFAARLADKVDDTIREIGKISGTSSS